MNWIALTDEQQLDRINEQSATQPVVIFKHSTRCSISMMVKKRFELDWNKLPEDLPLYFLDLIKYRDLSNQVAQDFEVYHESHQLLLIKDGECILDLSHGQVSVEEAMSVLVY